MMTSSMGWSYCGTIREALSSRPCRVLSCHPPHRFSRAWRLRTNRNLIKTQRPAPVVTADLSEVIGTLSRRLPLRIERLIGSGTWIDAALALLACNCRNGSCTGSPARRFAPTGWLANVCFRWLFASPLWNSYISGVRLLLFLNGCLPSSWVLAGCGWTNRVFRQP